MAAFSGGHFTLYFHMSMLSYVFFGSNVNHLMSLFFDRDGRYARNRTGCGRTRLAVSLKTKILIKIYVSKA